MKRPEPVVLSTSDDAAKIVTVTGWVDRQGRFWGNDERMARWSGATHLVCDCGTVHEKAWTKCPECHQKAHEERYAAMPQEAWDGEAPLYSDACDTYFSSEEELVEYVQDDPERNYENLRLLICEANYPREIDGSDHFSDDLPEDGELPSVLEAAFEALNEVIKKQPPLSWSPRRVRPTIESLPVLERA